MRSTGVRACLTGANTNCLPSGLTGGLWYRIRLTRSVSNKADGQFVLLYIRTGRMPSVTWNGASIIISPLSSPFKEARRVLAFLGCVDQHEWPVTTKGTCLFRKEGAP